MKPRHHVVNTVRTSEGYSIRIGQWAVVTYYRDSAQDDLQFCADGWLQLKFYDLKLFSA